MVIYTGSHACYNRATLQAYNFPGNTTAMDHRISVGSRVRAHRGELLPPREGYRRQQRPGSSATSPAQPGPRFGRCCGTIYKLLTRHPARSQSSHKILLRLRLELRLKMFSASQPRVIQSLRLKRLQMNSRWVMRPPLNSPVTLLPHVAL